MNGLPNVFGDSTSIPLICLGTFIWQVPIYIAIIIQ